MSDPLKLSPAYNSVETAVKCGFKKIMANNSKHQTQEFGFWVVLKAVKGSQKPDYHYTEPVTDGSGSEVTLTLPTGIPVVAHCHTHPKRISTGNYSTGDKRNFVKLSKIRSGISFYLLNPQGEIRRATFEKDFPAGYVVPW